MISIRLGIGLLEIQLKYSYWAYGNHREGARLRSILVGDCLVAAFNGITNNYETREFAQFRKKKPAYWLNLNDYRGNHVEIAQNS